MPEDLEKVEHSRDAQAKRAVLVSPDGLRQVEVNADNKLMVEASLKVGEISIGAVEIKDSDTDARVNVKSDGTNNAMVVVQNEVPITEVTQSGDWDITTLTSITNDVNISDGGNSITVDGEISAIQSGIWDIATLTGITNDVNVAQSGDWIISSITATVPIADTRRDLKEYIKIKIDQTTTTGVYYFCCETSDGVWLVTKLDDGSDTGYQYANISNNSSIANIDAAIAAVESLTYVNISGLTGL